MLWEVARPGRTERGCSQPQHVERKQRWKTGSAFRFRSRYRGQDVIEQGVVQEIVAESKLKLSWDWVGEGWTAPTELLFALEPEEGGTSVLISHSGFERIEPGAGLAARRNYASAWAEVLSDLKQLLTPAGVR